MDSSLVNAQAVIDSETLIREIARYLAAVDAFRAESCEPTWVPEPCAPTDTQTQAPRARDGARPATAVNETVEKEDAR